jgi:hypothetical protein
MNMGGAETFVRKFGSRVGHPANPGEKSFLHPIKARSSRYLMIVEAET